MGALGKVFPNSEAQIYHLYNGNNVVFLSHKVLAKNLHSIIVNAQKVTILFTYKLIIARERDTRLKLYLECSSHFYVSKLMPCSDVT